MLRVGGSRVGPLALRLREGSNFFRRAHLLQGAVNDTTLVITKHLLNVVILFQKLSKKTV